MRLSMSDHLSSEQIERYQQRVMSSDELLAANFHLAACAHCYERFGGEAVLGTTYRSIREELAAAEIEQPEHLRYDQLEAYAGNRLNWVEREIVETHFESCDDCLREADQLKLLEASNSRASSRLEPDRDRTSRESRPWWQRGPRTLAALSTAAGVILIAALIGILFLQKQVRDLRYEVATLEDTNRLLQAENAVATSLREDVARLQDELETLGKMAIEGTALRDAGRLVALDKDGNISGIGEISPAQMNLVKSALRTGTVGAVPPKLPGTRTPRVTLGPGDRETFGLIAPRGVMVTSDRPTFKWEPLSGAQSYVVFITDLSTGLEIESPALTEPAWTADNPLVRGQSYKWGVEAVRDGERVLAPSAKEAAAIFK